LDKYLENKGKFYWCPSAKYTSPFMYFYKTQANDLHLFVKNTYMDCHKNLTDISVVVMGSQMDGQMWSSHEALVFTL